MEASLTCGSCGHLKTFLNHPKYGPIEIDYRKNHELMAKLINEAIENSLMPFATCELGYLDKARERVVNGYLCDRYTSRTKRCRHCGEIVEED